MRITIKLISIAIVLFSFSAKSQNNLHFGVTGGINLSTIDGFENEDVTVSFEASKMKL